jgi:uncharacterized protein
VVIVVVDIVSSSFGRFPAMPFSTEVTLLAGAVLAAGLVSGFLAGFFGIGGGAIVVFALYETFRVVGVPEAVRMHLCIGTALAVMVPTTLTSFMSHRRRGSVDEVLARRWVVPVVAGVAAGAAVAAFADQVLLKLVFAVLAAVNGVLMLTGGLPWRLRQEAPTTRAMVGSGVAIGLLSTLMGIGGGVFGNMFLSLYGRPMHQVVGTSASLGVVIGIAGALGYMAAGFGRADLPLGSLGYVSLLAVLIMAPIASLVAPLGVRAAHGLSAARLKQAFGVFMLVLAARFWISLVAGV